MHICLYCSYVPTVQWNINTHAHLASYGCTWLKMKSYMYNYLFHIGICPMLQDPTNGKVFLLKNTAVFGCFNGYMVMGNSILTCNNGNWSGSPPTCQLPNP